MYHPLSMLNFRKHSLLFYFIVLMNIFASAQVLNPGDFVFSNHKQRLLKERKVATIIQQSYLNGDSNGRQELIFDRNGLLAQINNISKWGSPSVTNYYWDMEGYVVRSIRREQGRTKADTINYTRKYSDGKLVYEYSSSSGMVQTFRYNDSGTLLGKMTYLTIDTTLYNRSNTQLYYEAGKLVRETVTGEDPGGRQLQSREYYYSYNSAGQLISMRTVIEGKEVLHSYNYKDRLLESHRTQLPPSLDSNVLLTTYRYIYSD